MPSSFLPVAHATASHVTTLHHASAAVGDAIHQLAHAARSAIPCQDFTAAAFHDHSALLATALTAAGPNPIARALAELRDPLPWHYHYAPRDDAPDLAARVAFAELIGPRAPLTAPACRVGFTLMAPHTFYPLHNHPAVELYLVIAGTAEWIAPPAQRLVPPGDLILHTSNQPHAMRTSHEPLLALYAWSGDIDTPAVYI
jgi:quercetin dioxygenase-like cupin family protein